MISPSHNFSFHHTTTFSLIPPSSNHPYHQSPKIPTMIYYNFGQIFSVRSWSVLIHLRCCFGTNNPLPMTACMRRLLFPLLLIHDL